MEKRQDGGEKAGQFLGKDIVRGTEVRPGVWRYSIRGHVFDIPARYTPLKWLGQGSFGIVCSARDNQATEEALRTVAIKKIILNNAKIGDLQWKRTLREIRLMRHFDNENILGLKDIFELPSKEDYDEVYVVTELMDTDLHHIIRSPQELSDDHIQMILFQVLRGLKYIHSAHVLHRDLKPSNLFINKDVLLKIADFGLARVAHPEDNFNGFTQYVATRWYRAPEVILSWKQYTNAIDIWSVGCIFAELLMRKPLFPGKDHIKQVELICEIMGTPSDEDIECIASSHARQFMRNMGRKPKILLGKLIPKASPAALDLLERMLAFNPAKRITVEDALAHPYLAFFHDPEDEPVCHSVFDFSFEKFNLSLADFKMLIFQEMLHFHPEADPNLQRNKQLHLNTKTSPTSTPPTSPSQPQHAQQHKTQPNFRPIAPRPVNPQPQPPPPFSQQSQHLILQQQMKIQQGGQQPVKILPLPASATPGVGFPAQPPVHPMTSHQMPVFAPGGSISFLPQQSQQPPQAGFAALPNILPTYPIVAPKREASVPNFVPPPATTNQAGSSELSSQEPARISPEDLLSFDSPTTLMVETLLSSETEDSLKDLGDGMDLVEEEDPDDIFRSYLEQ